ncbi:carbohydrate kinase family protein [Aerococcus sanguinicola]|uniref:carbohydrate kinase family protein n=2 Tax=Aerococcus TaxID=1375 RepID=UPI0008A1FCB5|nr:MULTISPECIES: carbohydrate kinase family protein [unclassified Aerococcus]KAB0647296.1 carbohydrate kinase [Aerococcus sanguinicola]MDK6233242.1 carbohydrate kinase family protein [Aerococcus sp. UMB10185]MDK6856707.1 carbohydrate kinase family protein [Aerococcus sp. UMB7533]OFN00746.1 carbohydrate kinase [Aerococcus sp. HMSC062A02]OHO42836.1 carbohydrate kinase [Aerococcus sp. HMSC035B07]
MTNESYVAIIGGLNMDIAGISGPMYRERDSNIGHIYLSPGGVGRNIAHNLVQLEVPTYLVTAYGDDDFGLLVEKSCRELNISLDYAEKLEDEHTSTYLYVTDSDGDMITGVNDMDIVKRITPDFLADRLDFLNQAKICVIDANISRETIEWIVDHVEAPLYVEPVSVAKAARFEAVLDRIDTIKPNQYEAELYTGIKILDEKTARQAAEKLIELGVNNAFISLGAKGMVCANSEETHYVPVLESDVISANGAGDCAMATIVWANYHYGHELDIKEVTQLAQAAANLATSTMHSVYEDLSISAVVKRAQDYKQ